jgi:hypothetical protein
VSLLKILAHNGGIPDRGWKGMAEDYVEMIAGSYPALSRFDRIPLAPATIDTLQQVAKAGVPQAAMLVVGALLEYRSDLEHMSCAIDKIPIIESMLEIAKTGDVAFVHGYLGDFERYVKERSLASYYSYKLGHDKGDAHCTARIAYILLGFADHGSEQIAEQVFGELWPKRSTIGPMFAKMAADKGSPHGAYYYAGHLWNSADSRQENLEAVEYFVRAAEMGHPEGRSVLLEHVLSYDKTLVTQEQWHRAGGMPEQ